jgi:hypothetical protein
MLAAASAMLLAACSDANEAAEDRLEKSAETSAKMAGPVPAAFGLTEAQLLNADIVGPGGKEVGDVAKVLRGADGKVDRLLVEVEGSNPDRYVELPILGLRTVVSGDDTDLATSSTQADLMAMPEVPLPKP